MKLAAILLVAIGSVGLIATFVYMRIRLEQLKRWREEHPDG
jgi:hypothetical protein